jgi:stalled ribosome rescue protein Dom34
MLYKNCCGKNAERSFFLIIDMACDPTQHADLAAVIMQEGLAHLCLNL